VVSFLISGVGFVFFSYGRKMSRIPQLAAGLVLMLFPYFVSGILWMLLVAAAVLGILWLALLQGV
jgi:hypothetical protein